MPFGWCLHAGVHRCIWINIIEKNFLCSYIQSNWQMFHVFRRFDFGRHVKHTIFSAALGCLKWDEMKKLDYFFYERAFIYIICMHTNEFICHLSIVELSASKSTRQLPLYLWNEKCMFGHWYKLVIFVLIFKLLNKLLKFVYKKQHSYSTTTEYLTKETQHHDKKYKEQSQIVNIS